MAIACWLRKYHWSERQSARWAREESSNSSSSAATALSAPDPSAATALSAPDPVTAPNRTLSELDDQIGQLRNTEDDALIIRTAIAGIRVKVPADVFSVRLAGLPDGVTVEPGRIEVTFTGARGKAILRYSGLTATDAVGRTLPSYLQLAGDRLV